MAGKLLNTKRVKAFWFLLLAVLFFGLGMAIYFPNYSRLKALREEKERLDESIERLKAEIEVYQLKNERLTEDSFLFEEIARDRLGVIREDEIVIDIEE